MKYFVSIIASLTALCYSPVLFAQDAFPVIPNAYSSNTGLNYIRTWEASFPVTDPALLMVAAPKEARQITQYLDGLGRPLQTVIKKGALSSAGIAKDFVLPVIYDDLGREVHNYLPFAASDDNGSFKMNPFQQQQTFYQGQLMGQNETFYYGKTEFEPSPLNRPLSTYAPGNSWVGNSKGIKTEYWINKTPDDVKIWKVTDAANTFGTYSIVGTYAAGELIKTSRRDEENHQVIEFKDKTGLVILKKVQSKSTTSDDGSGSSHSDWLCTYYIYDDASRLRAVIQPGGVESLEANGWSISYSNNVILDEQCFRYEYDSRNRMTRKKVPGAGEVDMVYDVRDRVVFTQDVNLRAVNQWLTTLYDPVNRPVITALITYSGNVADFQQTVTTQTAYEGGQNGGIENSIIDHVLINRSPLPPGITPDVLTTIFYDDYSWEPAFSSSLSSTFNTTFNNLLFPPSTPSLFPETPVQATELKGFITGTRTKVLGQSGQYIYSVHFYDDKGRIIQEQSTNFTGGNDITTIQYSFNGSRLMTVQRQEKGGNNPQFTIVCTKNSYDDLWRLTKIEKKAGYSIINNGTLPNDWVIISECGYDECGRLKTKKLGRKKNSAGTYVSGEIDIERFDYNIRGWLQGMNIDYARNVSNTNYFGYHLGYDQPTNGLQGQVYVHPQLNGNIAGVMWKSKGQPYERQYDFTYDKANRLLGADFNQKVNTVFDKTAGIDFSVSDLSYDPNGNIRTMKQMGLIGAASQLIDDLHYEYKENNASNKLLSVSEGAATSTNFKVGDFTDKNTGPADYDYDGNGNLISDKNKDISSIAYNILNLPSLITVSGKGTIAYLYDAGGNKLKKEVTDNTTSPAKVTTTIYMGGTQYENDVLQFVGTEEGRIRFTPALGSKPAAFNYDYFERDHLGNTRIVLTDEQQQDVYPAATLEGSLTNSNDAVYLEKEYYNISAGNIVDKSEAAGIASYLNNNGEPPYNTNPNSQTTASSQKVYKLQAVGPSPATGLGMILKVMSGDSFDIYGKSFYNTNNTAGTNTTVPLAALLTDIIGAGSGMATAKGISVNGLSSNTAIANAFSAFLQSPGRELDGTAATPKAYINYICLDEQFRYKSGGFVRVGVVGETKEHHPGLQNVNISENGYLYIYCSNESPVPVFFDNLQVIVNRGPLVEETHYYPFGLTMAGISSKALGKLENRRKYNDGTELENKEFSDGSGLELYSTDFRSYDPQIGRFHQIDPLADIDFDWSPYVYVHNNPMIMNDPLGLTGDSSGTMEPLLVTPANNLDPIRTDKITLPQPNVAGLAVTISLEVAETGAGASAAGASATLTGGQFTIGVVGGIMLGGYIMDKYFPHGPVSGVSGSNSGDLIIPHPYIPIGGLKPITNPQVRPFTIPLQAYNNQQTKVYEIGGWDIASMKWQTLKYGIASTQYDTYLGEGNRRPDSQLEYMRNRYPGLVVRMMTLAVLPKTLALILENNLVFRYRMSNIRPPFLAPPEQGLPFGLNIK